MIYHLQSEINYACVVLYSQVTGVVEPFHDISLPIVEEKISKPANRNKKQNQSDESDRDSIPEKNNIDNKYVTLRYRST